MRPIDLLSSRYYSIKPKGHDGGSSRWRARPVMAAAILLLMSLAVLLPAMVLAQTANQAPTGLTAVPGEAEGSIFLDWDQSTDTNIDSYEYQKEKKATTFGLTIYRTYSRRQRLLRLTTNDDSATISNRQLCLSARLTKSGSGPLPTLTMKARNPTSRPSGRPGRGDNASPPPSGHQSVTLSWTACK